MRSVATRCRLDANKKSYGHGEVYSCVAFLERNFLKGVAGDRNNIILAAAGFNMSKLIAALFVLNFIHAFFGSSLV